MLHIHAWKDDKQGHVNTAKCVYCVPNLGYFNDPTVLSGNTFSSNNLMRLFIRKRWKLFTLFITVFCQAELFGYQRLVIRIVGTNKDGWRINAMSCCTAAKPLKPRRQPPPSWTDKIVGGWSLNHLSRTVRTAVHSNVNWAQLWISMLNLIFNAPSIHFLLTITCSFYRSGGVSPGLLYHPISVI